MTESQRNRKKEVTEGGRTKERGEKTSADENEPIRRLWAVGNDEFLPRKEEEPTNGGGSSEEGGIDNLGNS